jgi:hypothetical protein
MVLGFILTLVRSYIGPGLGGDVITAVLGFLTTIVVSFAAIVWYPFRQLIKRFKNKKGEDDAAD